MDRLSAADVMQLITDVGPAPMQIGACLLLEARPGFDTAAVRRCIADRVPAVPRLRQRLVRTPPGCGRPVWLDDPAFDVRHHIREQRCPAPGDDDALLGGGTVNDVILAAAAGAVGRLLASRGETLPALVVSVPVSARTSASAGHLGNEAGVMPVALPTGGDLPGRLDRTAAITRARKAPVPGTSAVLLGAVFRLLAALGLFRWFINHQRLVHTFITNVRGPSRRLRLGGATISGVVPVTVTAGNVTVSFGVLSYAGTLTVTVVADPGRLPDLEVLTGALRQELAECGPGADPRSPGTHPKQVEGEMPI